jgi:DNA-binding beta-propeller fold protein YncE
MPIPFRLRPVVRLIVLAAAFSTVGSVASAQAAELQARRVWQYSHAQGGVAAQTAEIVAYDEKTDSLWVAGVAGIDVLDRATGQLLAHIDVTNFGAVNSVAIHKGLAALAIENGQDKTLPGVVVFYNTRTRVQSGAPVVVGSLPDMLTFTPDGDEVLVANEGTPNPRPTPVGLSADDPVGSVSIIDVKTRTVTTVPVTPAIPGYASLRLFPAVGTLPSQPATYSTYDPEPEYIAVDPGGRLAYVTLQEANGVAVLNLRTRKFEKIVNLGLKDFSLPGNEIDPNDRDPVDPATNNGIYLRPVPVKGLYQPDSIAAYKHRGDTYLVMANEGDARDNGNGDSEDERRGSAGADASRLVPVTGPADLFRTTFSNVDSTPGNLVKFGAHSFSIRDASGRIVFDSGSQLDREAIRLGIYDDGRSDNKGVEPEGVALMHVDGRVLAFIGLERTLKSAIAIYDITDPREARFLQMVVSDGDLSPEGLTAFRFGKRFYLAAAHEVSRTTSLFEIDLGKGRGKGD